MKRNYNILIIIFRGLVSIPSEVLNELVKYELTKYYDDHLLERSSFFRTVTSEQIMKWSDELLKLPLTKAVSKELTPVALQIYKSKEKYINF